MSILRKILIIAVLAAIAINLSAQNVTNREAIDVAQKFLQQKVTKENKAKLSRWKARNIELGGNKTIKLVTFKSEGFVLLASDKSRFPVIGYSLKNNFDPQNIPSALENWLQYSVNHSVSSGIHPWWSKIKSEKIKKSQRSFPVVNQLLTSAWNQNWPYNAHCPEHPNGDNGHCMAGCVATAMAQIMYFWQYPDTGKGSETYFWGVDSTVQFGQTNYKWNDMDDYINMLNRDAIAEVIFHSGVSVNMNFGPNASGSSISYAASALKDHFRYIPTLDYLEKSQYTYDEWRMIMQNEMLNGRPVLYAGVDPNGGGHAFVLDGFKDSCFFHFNWGWGGSGNGYFHLNNLKVAGSNFSHSHRAVVGIMPYGSSYCGSYWMTAPDYEFDDGSGYSLYQNNSDCSYLIEHPVNGPMQLQITKWDLADAGDLVKIYDGEDASASLLAKFNGNQTPQMIKSSGNKVFVKFETDATGQGAGWKLKYTTTTTGMDKRKGEEVKIYPNPVSDILFIKGVSNTLIEVYNLNGQKMLSEQANPGEIHQLHLKDFSAGVYMLRLSDAEGILKREKLIVR